MGIIDIIIIVIILFLVYLIGSKMITISRPEHFDLMVGLQQTPHIGKFDDCQLIGTRQGFTVPMCKDLCNRMDSCAGISCSGPPFYECRTYNDTSLLKYDPRYISWFDFANNRIY